MVNPEALFQFAFESAPDATLIVSDDGRILMANAVVELLFGYSEAELIGQPVEMLLPERFRDSHTIQRQAFAGEPKVRAVGAGREFFGLRKDGTEISVDISLNPGRAMDAAVVLITFVDLAEQRRLEKSLDARDEEMQVSIANLEASEVSYRRLFEAAKDGILILDGETGRIDQANPFMIELLGIPLETLTGKYLWEIGALKDIVASQAAFQELKVNGFVRYENLPLETAQGHLVNVEVIGNLYTAGRETVIQCNIRDITDRRKAEETLRKAESQLRQSQKMDAFGQMAAGVAHDFNNILTIINGYAELVLGQIDALDPYFADVEEIARAGQQGASLTRQLLAFTRKQVLDPKLLDLNHLVRETQSMLRRVIGEDIELVDELAPGLWSIKVDPGQMQQVILNLALNARDAMPQGGKLTIETTNVDVSGSIIGAHPTIQAGPYILLSVTDTGVGMDEETRLHAFEPFFTTKGHGTGLGLATVHGIIEQSGGSIWLYSEVGQGTTLKIYLPQEDKPLDSIPRASAVRDAQQGSETILLVEDDNALRKLARQILQRRGYTVLDAAAGAEAMKVSAQYSGDIDLLVSDVVMPGMRGTELMSRLSETRPKMKTLFLSGYSNEVIRGEVALGPDVGFLQKPYTSTELTTKVRALIDGG